MVEFVSYTGAYPNLCSGELTLRIDGKLVRFGIDKNPIFWYSGGGITRNWEAYKGAWLIDLDMLPEEYHKYAEEIIYVINTNIPYGCCGGCI